MALKPQIQVAPSGDDLAEALARRFYELTLWAIGEREVAAVAISGGRTPEGFFRRLAAAPWAGKVLWDRILLFWSDERHVPYESPESNYGQARSLLLGPLGLEGPQVHPWPVSGPPEACAEAYGRDLGRYVPSGPGGIPALDAVFLGIGEDGHTASLFPGSFSPEEPRPALATVSPTGQSRLSLGPRTLQAAHHVVFAVSGAAKAPVLGRLAAAKAPDPALPASLVYLRGKSVTLLTDAAAAAGLG